LPVVDVAAGSGTPSAPTPLATEVIRLKRIYNF
jgi:hypothetical protein